MKTDFDPFFYPPQSIFNDTISTPTLKYLIKMILQCALVFPHVFMCTGRVFYFVEILMVSKKENKYTRDKCAEIRRDSWRMLAE